MKFGRISEEDFKEKTKGMDMAIQNGGHDHSYQGLAHIRAEQSGPSILHQRPGEDSFSWKNSTEPKESLCPRFNNNIVVLARAV